MYVDFYPNSDNSNRKVSIFFRYASKYINNIRFFIENFSAQLWYIVFSQFISIALHQVVKISGILRAQLANTAEVPLHAHNVIHNKEPIAGPPLIMSNVIVSHSSSLNPTKCGQCPAWDASTPISKSFLFSTGRSIPGYCYRGRHHQLVPDHRNSHANSCMSGSD